MISKLAKVNSRVALCTSVALLLLSPAALLAGESALQITDCKGELRFTQTLSEADKVNVNFTVEDASQLSIDGVSLLQITDSTPKNKSGILREVGDEQLATFEGVPAGSWKLCTSNGEFVKFSKVSLGKVPVQTAAANSGVIGAPVIALGAVAGAAALSSDSFSSSSSSDGRGGAGAFDNSSAGEGSSSAGSIVAPDTAPAISFDDDDFELGAKAAPLSPAS